MWNPYDTLPANQKRLLAVGTVAFVLIVWSVLSGAGIIGPNKLPAPWTVGATFVRMVWDSDAGSSPLAAATLYSLARILVAGVLVVSVGIPTGILMGASPKINAALSPLLDPFRSAPIVAVLPILIIWLGIEEASKITFLFMGSVVYLIPMVRDAVLAVPSTYYVSARDLGATPWEAIRHSVVPIAMPRIADAIIVSVSVMWTYITVAEYVNAEVGLGRILQLAQRRFAMDEVFVGLFVIIALALVTYQAMLFAKAKLYPWEVE